MNTKTARDGDQFTLRTRSGSTIYGQPSEVAMGLAAGALLATNTAYDLVIPAGSEARLTLTAPLMI